VPNKVHVSARYTNESPAEMGVWGKRSTRGCRQGIRHRFWLRQMLLIKQLCTTQSRTAQKRRQCHRVFV